MGILKTSVLSAVVAGSAMFVGAQPADAQVYFGFGSGGYYSPGYSHGHYGHGYPGYHVTPWGGGHYRHNDLGWGGRNAWDIDRGDYRRAHREFDREHRQFHRRWDRGFDWDD